MIKESESQGCYKVFLATDSGIMPSMSRPCFS